MKDAAPLPVAPNQALVTQRLEDFALPFFQAGEESVAFWKTLEPLLRESLGYVREAVDDAKADGQKIDLKTAQQLVGTMSVMLRETAKAGRLYLQAADGLYRLKGYLTGGPPKPAKDPKELDERALTMVVLETAKAIQRETGRCPVCETKTVTVS